MFNSIFAAEVFSCVNYDIYIHEGYIWKIVRVFWEMFAVLKVVRNEFISFMIFVLYKRKVDSSRNRSYQRIDWNMCSFFLIGIYVILLESLSHFKIFVMYLSYLRLRLIHKVVMFICIMFIIIASKYAFHVKMFVILFSQLKFCSCVNYDICMRFIYGRYYKYFGKCLLSLRLCGMNLYLSWSKKKRWTRLVIRCVTSWLLQRLRDMSVKVNNKNVFGWNMDL